MFMGQTIILQRCSLFSKLTQRYHTTPIKIPAGCCEDIAKLIPECIWRLKGSRRAKTTWINKNQVERLTPSDMETYSKATAIARAQHCCQHRHMLNGTEEEVQEWTHTQEQLIFNKVQRQFNSKRKAFSTNDARTIGSPDAEKGTLLHTLYGP